MKKKLGLFGTILLLVGTVSYKAAANEVPISGRAPSLAAEGNKVHMIFASGDSILYSYSIDKGKSFSAPRLVVVQKDLMVGGGRGPQLVCTKEQLLIAAPVRSGNFYT